MFLRLIYDDMLAEAAYLIGCQASGEAIVVDPQRDVDRYIELADANGLRIVAAAETHIHADFLSGTRELAEQFGAKLYLSGEGGHDWSYRWLNSRLSGGSYEHQLLLDGDAFRIGNIAFRVMHTPGHTPEHISFVITDQGSGANEPMGVLSGDFVFVGDVGRPDLLETAAGMADAKEPAARLLAQSAKRFVDLPDYLQVWPAHGAGSSCGKALGAVPQSTVGYEKRFNPAIKLAGDDDAFVRYVLQGQPEPPLYFGRMKIDNRDGVALLGELPRPALMDAEKLGGTDSMRTAIVDTRPWAKFSEGHIPGALHAPLGSNYVSVVGSYVKPEEPIVLIVEPCDLERAVRGLVRIGLDSIVGWSPPEVLDEMRASGAHLGRTANVDVQQARAMLASGERHLLDVRRLTEYNESHIDRAQNIAHTRLLDRLDELPADRPLLVHCRTGVRSAFACALLARHGRDAMNVSGGIMAWTDAGLPVVSEDLAAV